MIVRLLPTLIVPLVLATACGSRPSQRTIPTPTEPVPVVVEAPAPAVEEPEPLPPKLRLERVAYGDLPGWQADQVGDALPALAKSCKVLMRRNDDRQVGRDDTGGFVKDWREACGAQSALDASDHKAVRGFFEEHFTPFLAANNEDATGGFTGYYEASLKGSRKRKGRYKTPLYKRPDDLVMVNMRNFVSKPRRRRIAGRVINGTLKPYETRSQIRRGALRGKKLELVWIDDPVDGFFTQIQGSGLVELDDGTQMRIGYAAQNGHSYTAIGRELIKDGHITREEMSMQAIRSWLNQNPKEAAAMMDRNEAYVFFTELSGQAPVGSQGVELTPERSAAVDRRFIPQSVPLFIDTVVPSEDGTTEDVFQQLVVAQDSGGAIRGPVRADIFWGVGERAASIAGRLKSRGRYFLLLPNAVAERR